MRAGRHLELRDAPDLSYGNRPLENARASGTDWLDARRDTSELQFSRREPGENRSGSFLLLTAGAWL